MIDSDIKKKFEKQLEVLRLQYLQSFPDKKRELEFFWKQLDQGHVDSVGAQAIARDAHKLAGSAGCYGFADISGHATSLERVVTESVTDGETNWETACTSIKGQLRQLIQALEYPAGDPESP